MHKALGLPPVQKVTAELAPVCLFQHSQLPTGDLFSAFTQWHSLWSCVPRSGRGSRGCDRQPSMEQKMNPAGLGAELSQGMESSAAGAHWPFRRWVCAGTVAPAGSTQPPHGTCFFPPCPGLQVLPDSRLMLAHVPQHPKSASCGGLCLRHQPPGCPKRMGCVCQEWGLVFPSSSNCGLRGLISC